jgi:hypothetical protein
MKKQIIMSIFLTTTISIANTNNIYQNVNSIFPTIYGITSGTKSSDITYGAGLRYPMVKYAGIGAEYREFKPKVTFNNEEYRLSNKAAGLFLFTETTRWKTLFLGIDAGGGILWDNTKNLNISETYVLSGRINASKQITRYIDITLWAGINHIGKFKVFDQNRIGTAKSQEIYDAGAAIRIYNGRISNSLYNYLF